VIEKSNGAIRFSTVSSVQGAGYTFVDPSAP
jgi:hypothetical protein